MLGRSAEEDDVAQQIGAHRSCSLLAEQTCKPLHAGIGYCGGDFGRGLHVAVAVLDPRCIRELEGTHHGGRMLVWVVDRDAGGGNSLSSWRRSESRLGSVGIRTDQPADAQLGTAEIPHDHDDRIDEVERIDGPQNGGAGAPIGLAGVIRPPDAITQAPGGAVMRCVEPGALQRAEQIPGRFLGVGGLRDTEEA